MQTNLMTIW